PPPPHTSPRPLHDALPISFEAHSYRDLARTLEEAGRPVLAALQYEVLLAADWHTRFGPALKQVVLEEYAALLRDPLPRQALGGRSEEHTSELQSLTNLVCR